MLSEPKRVKKQIPDSTDEGSHVGERVQLRKMEQCSLSLGALNFFNSIEVLGR